MSIKQKTRLSNVTIGLVHNFKTLLALPSRRRSGCSASSLQVDSDSDSAWQILNIGKERFTQISSLHLLTIAPSKPLLISAHLQLENCRRTAADSEEEHLEAWYIV